MLEATLVELVKCLFQQFQLTNKMVAYLKDKDASLVSLASTLSQVVLCDLLQLQSPYLGACYGG